MAAAALLRSLARKMARAPPAHHHPLPARSLHGGARSGPGASYATQPPTRYKVLGYEPRSHLSGPQVLPRWFSSVASNGSPMQSQISETNKSGSELKQSDAQKSSEGVAPKVMAFSPLEAATAKPRSSPLTSESTKVRRSEILTKVTFYMIPVTLLVSRNSISTSLLVGAVFHQVYMFHKEILLDYVHHDITRKWSLIYFKLLLLVMAKDTIMYFNMFPFY